MTRSSRYTPESPEVAAVLNGVWKSGVKTYYRIDADGKHIDVRIREELVAALGISSKLATRLLQQAELPCAPFVCTREREKAQASSADHESITVEPDDEMEIELEDDEMDEDCQPEFPAVQINASHSSNKSKQAIGRAERAGKAAAVHAKKFELVRQGSYTGIFNKDTATTELFHTEGEALEYLRLLLHGYEGFYQAVQSGYALEAINYND
jgi:azurin